MTKILVLGHGDHGKDKFAEMLGLPYISSSLYCSEKIVFPWFESNHPGLYKDAQECFDDRRNNRDVWYKLIEGFGFGDRARLTRKIFEQYDIYTGMRCPMQLEASITERLFDYVFWVCAKDRKPLEPRSSMQIEYDPTIMNFIDNNGPLDNLRIQAEEIAAVI